MRHSHLRMKRERIEREKKEFCIVDAGMAQFHILSWEGVVLNKSLPVFDLYCTRVKHLALRCKMQTLDLCKFWKQGLFLRVPTVPTCIPRNPNITIRTVVQTNLKLRYDPFLSNILFALASRKWLKFHASPGETLALLLLRCRLHFDIPFPSPLGLFSHPEKHVDGKIASEK